MTFVLVASDFCPYLSATFWLLILRLFPRHICRIVVLKTGLKFTQAIHPLVRWSLLILVSMISKQQNIHKIAKNISNSKCCLTLHQRKELGDYFEITTSITQHVLHPFFSTKRHLLKFFHAYFLCQMYVKTKLQWCCFFYKFKQLFLQCLGKSKYN